MDAADEQIGVMGDHEDYISSSWSSSVEDWSCFFFFLFVHIMCRDTHQRF